MAEVHILMIAAAEYPIDARIRREAESLVRAGHTVQVLALHPNGARREYVLCGVTVTELPVRKYRGNSLMTYARVYASFMWRVRRHLRGRAAVPWIIVHSMPEFLVFSARRARRLGSHLTLDIHDLTSHVFATKFSATHPLRRLLRGLERVSLAQCHSVITVHDDYARILAQEYGVPSAKITVLANGPDVARFSWKPPRAWGVSPVFSFHGTVAERFGVLELVQAFEVVHAAFPESRLRLLGYGDARPALEARVSTSSARHAIELSPAAVPVDSMPAELAMADIGVAPNRPSEFMSHVIPTKVLEYAASGRIIVAAGLPLLGEILPEGGAVLYEPGHGEELAQAMLSAARLDPSAAQQMARLARDAIQPYTWANQEPKLLRLAAQVAGS